MPGYGSSLVRVVGGLNFLQATGYGSPTLPKKKKKKKKESPPEWRETQSGVQGSQGQGLVGNK